MAPRLYCRSRDFGQDWQGGPEGRVPPCRPACAGELAPRQPRAPSPRGWCMGGARGAGQGRGGPGRPRSGAPGRRPRPPTPCRGAWLPPQPSTRPSRHPPLPWKPAAAPGGGRRGLAGERRPRGLRGRTWGRGPGALRGSLWGCGPSTAGGKGLVLRSSPWGWGLGSVGEPERQVRLAVRWVCRPV